MNDYQSRSGIREDRDSNGRAQRFVRDAHGRFAAGCQANPRGRPKALRFADDDSLPAVLLRSLSERVPVIRGGRKKNLSKYEIIVQKLVADAMRDDPGDRARVVKLMQHLGLPASFDRLQAYEEATRAANHAGGWTNDLEERFELIEAEYEEDDRENADIRAFLEDRSEEFQRFAAARRRDADRHSE